MDKTQRIFRATKLFCYYIGGYVIIYLFKPIECTSPRVNCNVNSGLSVIITSESRFVNFNKCTILVPLTVGKAVHVWGYGVYGNSL